MSESTEHVVFHPSPSGRPGFTRAATLADAVAVVERLRNDHDVTDVEVAALTTVPLEIRPYFYVAVAGQPAPVDGPRRAAASEPAPAAPQQEPPAPRAHEEEGHEAEVHDPATHEAEAHEAEAEETEAGPSVPGLVPEQAAGEETFVDSRGMGFFA